MSTTSWQGPTLFRKPTSWDLNSVICYPKPAWLWGNGVRAHLTYVDIFRPNCWNHVRYHSQLLRTPPRLLEFIGMWTPTQSTSPHPLPYPTQMSSLKELSPRAPPVFDILGLFAPSIIFLQDLWRLNFSWDDTVPKDCQAKWKLG